MIRQASFAVVLATGLVGAPVFAQPANPYNGNWTMKFDWIRATDIKGHLVVQDGTGTWQVLTRSAENNCFGRKVPITVVSTSDEEFVFIVNRSKGMASCEDIQLKFRKVDATTLKGEFAEQNRAITLTRD